MCVTYKQKSKSSARSLMLAHAVNSLTTERKSACCVKRTYVRDVINYFKSLEDTKEQVEAEKIDINYVTAWERLHDACIGNKRPEDLVVCYLAGPEPENDFQALIDLGVLPQNIWAFESENKTYLQAIEKYNHSNFPQPKIVKTSIESFFKHTPKVFDIVYLDACGTLISNKHALRCISTLFKYHRLSSLGVLITNFANADITNPVDYEAYIDAMTKYFLLREDETAKLIKLNNVSFGDKYTDIAQKIINDFPSYYGDFITATICNIGSVVIPALRFMNSDYWKYFTSVLPQEEPLDIAEINTIKYNTLLKYFATNSYLHSIKQNDAGSSKIDKLIAEMSGESERIIGCLKACRILYNLKDNRQLKKEILETVDFFDNSDNLYQFLDKSDKTLFFDLAINQLAYPMHYNSQLTKRCRYKAKSTEMFMDSIVFDECRYIYEWLPTIHQIKNAFSNNSWQYIFRFALDGLVKQRLEYNNEFFFRGSVVPKAEKGFQQKKIPPRIIIEEDI